MTITDFLLDRDDLSKTTLAERPFPVLTEGDVLLEVDRVGLSANNITYAVLGESMGYWKFFPADDGLGSMPTWGHATVVESNVPEIETGARYFGYYPLSSHLKVTPSRANERGFVDGTPHRRELPPVYQRYVRVSEDNVPGSPEEDQDALWRPLFTTSFGAADFIDGNDAFGASTAVLTSASSKTALAAAFCLNQAASSLELVGLTSPGNVEFCESTGYYDRVLSYDQLSELGDEPLVVIDFAGSDETLEEISDLAGDRLKWTVIVGVTHWQDRDRTMTEILPGREFFFLPAWIEKRREDWGPTEFFAKSERTYGSFAPTVGAWLDTEVHEGWDAIGAAYLSVLNGESRPNVGHILQVA